jgi:hypothetical protein
MRRARHPHSLYRVGTPEENARTERLTDLGAYRTEPRDSSVSDEDLLTLNPGLRRLALGRRRA